MGEFIIPIRIQEENDLNSEFDPSGMSFSSDLVAYLSDYIEDRRLGEKVSYEVTSAKPVDMERLRKTYLLHIDKLRRRNRHEITRNKASAIRLLVIGILFILAGIFFSAGVNEVIPAIIATVGSFSVCPETRCDSLCFAGTLE